MPGVTIYQRNSQLEAWQTFILPLKPYVFPQIKVPFSQAQTHREDTPCTEHNKSIYKIK